MPTEELMNSFVAKRGATLGFARSGAGRPALVLHGAYSTHREIRSAVDSALQAHGCDVIYVDLPGMGESSAIGVETSDDVLDVLEELIDVEFDGERVLVIGHSFGAHLARGLAARRPAQVAGLALLCPFVTGEQQVEPYRVVLDEPEAAEGLDPELREDFAGYFVVRTSETVARFIDAVVPSMGRYDTDIVERLMTASDFAIDPSRVDLDAPTLMVTGRVDSMVGYRRQQEIVAGDPRATSVIVADAGHALIHEKPALLAALLSDLIGRAIVAG